MENVKDWLDKKGYHNSGLRTDRNHRIDLYLSDVLDEYRTEQLRLGSVVGQSEQLADFKCPPHDRCKNICDECAVANGLKQG